ncbi:hypothetical protein AMTRI_Chr01g104240 [Amborella trichopoda]
MIGVEKNVKESKNRSKTHRTSKSRYFYQFLQRKGQNQEMEKLKEKMGNQRIHDWSGKEKKKERKQQSKKQRTSQNVTSTNFYQKKKTVKSRYGEIKRENGELANP